MKKKWVLLFIGLVIIGGILFLVVSKDPVRHSVSVTFLCYTNRDSRGMNDMYTWAWFRIENRSPYMLSCQRGALDVERAGAWLQDTCHHLDCSGFARAIWTDIADDFSGVDIE